MGDPLVKTAFVLPSNSHFVYSSLVLYSGVYFYWRKSHKKTSNEEKQATQSMRLKSLPCEKSCFALCEGKHLHESAREWFLIQRATYFGETISLCQ